MLYEDLLYESFTFCRNCLWGEKSGGKLVWHAPLFLFLILSFCLFAASWVVKKNPPISSFPVFNALRDLFFYSTFSSCFSFHLITRQILLFLLFHLSITLPPVSFPISYCYSFYICSSPLPTSYSPFYTCSLYLYLGPHFLPIHSLICPYSSFFSSSERLRVCMGVCSVLTSGFIVNNQTS